MMSHFDISLLHTLPLEIRHHIYEHILPEYDEQPKCFSEVNITELKRTIKTLFHGQPQYYEEALDWFYTKNTFSVYLTIHSDNAKALAEGLYTSVYHIRFLHLHVATTLDGSTQQKLSPSSNPLPQRSLRHPVWPSQLEAWDNLCRVLLANKSRISNLVLEDWALPLDPERSMPESQLLPSYTRILASLQGITERVEIYPCCWQEQQGALQYEYSGSASGGHGPEEAKEKRCYPLVWTNR